MDETQKLLQAVVAGDRVAFQKLYAQFADRVYNTVLSYCQNVADAEEVTQDVFTKIYRNAGQFKNNSSVSTWIYRIAVNTSLNFIKKRKRYAFLAFLDTSHDQPDFEHPGMLMEKKEEAKYLFAAIDTLPPQQKTAFILSFVEELPRQEVADIMETTLKALESLLQRAKQNLRKNLKNAYPHRRKKK